MPPPKPWFLAQRQNFFQIMYTNGSEAKTGRGKLMGPIRCIKSGAEQAKPGTPNNVIPGLLTVRFNSITMNNLQNLMTK